VRSGSTVTGSGVIQLADVETRERLPRDHPASLRGSRLQQEPADEREPGSGEGALNDEEREAPGDEQERESAGDDRGGDGGGRGIPSAQPQERAQHAAAVERQSREHVERDQYQVDHPQPLDDGISGRRQAGEFRQRQAEPADQSAHQRPGDRDAELGRGRREHTPELSHTAEHPERDAGDLHALALGHDRVAKLVQHQ
jgi:hypothetical protein